MNRFFSRCLERLSDYALNRAVSSIYTPPSVLATPHHLRDFFNQSVKRNVWLSGFSDPYNTMWTDREILIGKQHGYDPAYVDPRVVYEKVNTQTSLTCYKNITLIDVDSIADVEIASRIYDSAILVLPCLDGVKIESIAIDLQMTRFQFPRLIFLDDINQEEVDPSTLVDEVKSKLNHRCDAIQVPICIDDCYIGFVDLVKLEAYYFSSEKVGEVPEDMKASVLNKRRELIEIVSEVDDKLSEAFRGSSQISKSDLDDAIRRATIARKFVPIFMGIISDSDERYNGLELLMEGVIRYLPSPTDVSNYALDQNRNGEKVELSGSIDAPFVAKVFTNVHRMYQLLTYLRIYQGVIKKGDFITNVNTGKKIQIPRLFKRHDNKIEEVDEAHAGEIVIVFDAILKSGDTFTDGSVRYIMTSADVPTYLSQDSGGKF